MAISGKNDKDFVEYLFLLNLQGKWSVKIPLLIVLIGFLVTFHIVNDLLSLV
ncbi:hypothetical protein ACE6H2_026403 [Prunus campanulata]